MQTFQHDTSDPYCKERQRNEDFDPFTSGCPVCKPHLGSSSVTAPARNDR